MVDFDALNQENHQIAEYSRVLSYLIENRLICDTDITCNLFFDYIGKVNEHLDSSGRQFYMHLLNADDQQTVNMATNFMNGSKEIKRVLKQYMNEWCKTKKQGFKIKDHERFISETNDFFEIVLNRIQDEQEKIYPMLRRILAESDAE